MFNINNELEEAFSNQTEKLVEIIPQHKREVNAIKLIEKAY
jgi:hypothetical protein